MRTIIRQMLDIIGSEPEYTDANLQLVYMLEISNGHSVDPYHLTELSEEQLTIRLTVDEQHEIAAELMQMIENNHPVSASLMWAISKATPEVILSHVQDFILNNYTKMDNGYLFQCIITIDNGTFSDDRNVLAKLKFRELKAMFEIIAQYPEDMFSLAKTAKGTREWLDIILDRMGG